MHSVVTCSWISDLCNFSYSAALADSEIYVNLLDLMEMCRLFWCLDDAH